MAVEISAAACAALITAPLAGLGTLAAQMIGRGGRVRLAFGTFARSKGDVAVIIVYDVLGAVLAVLVLVLLGISKPSPLVSYFHTDPWISWMVFGLVGPAFAIAFLDRVPVVRLAELSTPTSSVISEEAQKQIKASVADGATLRRKSVERIFKCHYEDLRFVEDVERAELQRRAQTLILGGSMHFDDVARQIKSYVGEYRDGEMPPELAVQLERRGSWPTDEDVFSAGLTLVGVALDAGLTRPVNIACRVAESIAERTPTPDLV